MVVLAVGGIAAVAQFGDLGAALGVDREWGWGNVWGLKAKQGAVQVVEFLEFRVDVASLDGCVGGGLGEGDGFS